RAYRSVSDTINSYDLGNIKDSSRQLNSRIENAIVQASSEAGKRLAKDAGRVAIGNVLEDVGDLISLQTIELRNPHMEFVFRGILQRAFNFEFKFMPRSPEEAKKIKDIERIFKLNALPEVDRHNDFGVFYKYPAEFEIMFISNNVENP